MQFFYAQDLESDFYTLPPEESKHCVKVLRMVEGDEIQLTDGRGTLCRAHIIAADSRGCAVEVFDRQQLPPRNHYLHIAVAPTKNSARIEWFVEKAVEIGIDEITPVICEHSERESQNFTRLEKIITSAMKQSLKVYRPILNPAIPLMDFLQQSHQEQKLMCYCAGDERHYLQELYTPGKPAVVLIGPEGDFSPMEIKLALQQDFKPVTLGDCRLRTETAALYATTAINFMNTHFDA